MTQQKRAEDITQKILDHDPYIRWLGISLTDVTPGAAVLRMTLREEMLNGYGIAHGGILFSLADSALAIAANTRGRWAISLEGNINFLQKTALGEQIEARAEEVSLGQNYAVYRVTVTRSGDTPVATFRGTVIRTGEEHPAP